MSQEDKKIRINKYLSMCGLGSRRKVEEYLLKKQVYINGSVVVNMASTVDPENDKVKCAGVFVKPNTKLCYVMFNKPRGYITTLKDPQGRPTVMNLLPQRYKTLGIVPVGRLDKDTEGLLLLTNDGEMANRIMHPRYESNKEYVLVLEEPLEEDVKAKIEAGARLREFQAQPCKVEYLDKEHYKVKMTIHEGKKRQIRIIFKKFKNTVKRLRRITLGPLDLGNLKSGDFRDLRPKEIKELKQYVSMDNN